MAILNQFERHNIKQVTNEIIRDQQHGNTNERGHTSHGQGEVGENTPFNKQM